MATVKKRSFGIVPVAVEQGGSLLLLILRAYKNWDFPKGGADEGESPLDAATRELKEETGIQHFNFEWGEQSMDTEIYAGGKVASYFLARVEKQELILPVSEELGRPEHDEYRWVSYAEARDLLSPRLIPILDWAFSVASG
jgi:8-oxo-dGTP pyrophosphatase MutT (NUDIX family)